MSTTTDKLAYLNETAEIFKRATNLARISEGKEALGNNDTLREYSLDILNHEFDQLLHSIIQSRFSNGGQGVAYIPRPVVLGRQALYQDQAGVFPVTADGDPVGLMLDMKHGGELGEELAEIFEWETPRIEDMPDTGSGWNVFEICPLEEGKRYKVTYDIEGYAGSGTLGMQNSFNRFAGSVNPHTNIASNGHVEINAECISSGAFQLISRNKPNVSGPNEATYKNISVREIPGIHVSSPDSASRLVYRTDGILHWLENGPSSRITVLPSDSMRWALVNADICPHFTSYYALKVGSAATANSLSGFSLSGADPATVGDFFRSNGTLVRRVGTSGDPLEHQFSAALSHSTFIASADTQAGVQTVWRLNGATAPPKETTRQGPNRSPAPEWGLLTQGSGTSFPITGEFYGSIHHEGGYDPRVFTYLAANMPSLTEFTA